MLSSSSFRKNKEVLAINGGGKFGKGICFHLHIDWQSMSLLNMTPPIHHLKSVWEIHLPLIRLITRSFNVSSLSQYYQIIGRVIHMFKRSPSETYIESAIYSYPVSPCRPSLCPVQFTSYSVSPSKSMTHFLSLMGDTSRPSCDKFCSVDFSSLYGIKT
jgi:hypothetical protein